MLSSKCLTVLLCISAAATTVIFHLWFSQAQCADDGSGYFYRANREAGTSSESSKHKESSPQEDMIQYSLCSPLKPLRFYVNSIAHPLAEALANHPAATKDEKEACLFIAFTTTGEPYSTRPDSWSLAGEPGLNHVVINLNNDVSIVPEGREMIVQAAYESGGFRPDRDFSLSPDVNVFDREAWRQRPSIMPLKREKPFSLVVDIPSSSNASLIPEVHCVGDCFTSLVSTSFCLIPPSPTFHIRLLASLRAKCIPVVLSTTQPLPFQDQLDWRTASFRFPQSMADFVPEMLEEVVKEDVMEMRRKGKVFLDRIDDAQALSKSLVAALSERIHVSLPVYPEVPGNLIYPSGEEPEVNETLYAPRIHSRTGAQKLTTHNLYSRTRWNSGRDLTYTPNTIFDVPLMPGDAAVYEGTREGLLAAPGTKGLGLTRDQEQFTVMILTYNRDSGVKKIIEKLRFCPYLNKIIVVWNNLERRPNGTWPEIHVPVEFVLAERNTLLSRFLPYDRIETENRDRIVGYPDRYHRFKNKKPAYGLGAPCTYSLVLTGFAMMHKEFLYEFSYNQHPSILEHIDKHRNCEDIAMNFLVAHLTRRPPLKVVKKLSMSNGSKAGLSARGGHYVKRDECMAIFAEIYGYNPLLYSQEVAVPKNMGRCVPGL
ncbi:hypothetical protein PRIPAC_77332 [Pristionchus pacificus]|uniref:Uncharacterized protein n=1 Tax=Pristionchus pacificus TaxID=54126 RepID=A0A2A6CL14_PRIPA|nr:hypothetical protein PRIPAC_77332 [Pristionchus pacificus]|eukprot:PDM78767.1 hypothetical protein PRIPAC_31346 [Pristionchus pacificus]